MPILSDRSIRGLIGEHNLVPNGTADRIDQNSYNFRAGVAHKAGCLEPPTVFSDAETSEFLIQPGEMVWIRTYEQVKLPNSLAGLWVQTNALSRKGLMLVNISMVEPGYEGPLACLFVNFGKRVIGIQSETTIAKMIFMQIDTDVENPYTERPDLIRYDHELRELAIDQPTTFLQIADFAANIRDARAAAIRDVEEEAGRARTQLAGEMGQLRIDEISAFREDALKSVRRSFGWAAGAILLLTAATVGAAWLQGKLLPDVEKVARSQAEDVLSERVTVSGNVPTRDQVLLQRLNALGQRIDQLENGSREPEQ